MNKLFQPLAAALLLASALTVNADPVRYQASPGSKLKLEGTSTVHDWTVSSGIMGGYIEFESDYPLDPAKPNSEAKITPKVEVRISVRSLQSGKSLMDDIMWDNLKVKDNPYITYKLTEWKPRDRKPGELPHHEINDIVGVALGVNAVDIPGPARAIVIEFE